MYFGAGQLEFRRHMFRSGESVLYPRPDPINQGVYWWKEKSQEAILSYILLSWTSLFGSSDIPTRFFELASGFDASILNSVFLLKLSLDSQNPPGNFVA